MEAINHIEIVSLSLQFACPTGALTYLGGASPEEFYLLISTILKVVDIELIWYI